MKKILSSLLLSAFAFGFSQSTYYNEYTNNISSLNWETVSSNLMLSSRQKQQLLELNNQYPTYDSWNNNYRDKPERWSADRYSSIQRIMGNDKYLKFKNKYYKGRNPVAEYNRNKNADKRYKHLKNKAKKNKFSKKWHYSKKGKGHHKGRR